MLQPDMMMIAELLALERGRPPKLLSEYQINYQAACLPGKAIDQWEKRFNEKEKYNRYPGYVPQCRKNLHFGYNSSCS